MKSNNPIFKNTAELADVLATLRKTSPNKRKDLPKLKDTTSLFDLFENLREAKSKEESNSLVKQNKLLSDLVEGKQDARRLINIKTNPLLAAVSDVEGRVHVGGHQIDILDESGMRDLMILPGGNEVSLTSTYSFTEFPPEEWVQNLPCGPLVVLPGYPTHFFDMKVGGRVIVVQLWKGSCPDAAGHGAGGVGAEVGLYNRDTFQPGVWWPDHEHKKMIEFTLFNPVTTGVFFTDDTAVPIWWSHKWMKFPSYDQYRIDQNHQVPASTEEYILRYRIEGRSFDW